MKPEEKKGVLGNVIEKIVHTNKEEHSPDARNNARLGYEKGNVQQDKPKNTKVWDTCPVLDEQGKPLEG